MQDTGAEGGSSGCAVTKRWAATRRHLLTNQSWDEAIRASLSDPVHKVKGFGRALCGLSHVLFSHAPGSTGRFFFGLASRAVGQPKSNNGPWPKAQVTNA